MAQSEAQNRYHYHVYDDHTRVAFQCMFATFREAVNEHGRARVVWNSKFEGCRLAKKLGFQINMETKP